MHPLNLNFQCFTEMGRGRTSPVWDEFAGPEVTEENESGEKQCQCNTCKMFIPYKGCTNNMLTHLRNHHRVIYERIAPSVQRGPAKKRKRGERSSGAAESLFDEDQSEVDESNSGSELDDDGVSPNVQETSTRSHSSMSGSSRQSLSK